MSERAESTLGYERLSQPLFKLDEEAFVHEILASVPPMPSYHPRMKALNSKGATSVANLPGKNAVSPARMAALLADDSFKVVDLRRPEAFGGAHIPGALNIGAGQNLSLWAGWIISPDKRLLFVNDKGDDEEARRSLVRVGLDQIEGFLEGGMPAWISAGMGFTRTTQLSTKEVAERDHKTQILDVRSNREWCSGHIEDAIHIPLGDLEDRASELQKGSNILVICGSGYRSSIAASLLQANGFVNIASIHGGMAAWDKRQLQAVS
jgi:hydroxyacylglutathione hydrolase